jgi:hypothetical protein
MRVVEVCIHEEEGGGVPRVVGFEPAPEGLYRGEGPGRVIHVD